MTTVSERKAVAKGMKQALESQADKGLCECGNKFRRVGTGFVALCGCVFLGRGRPTPFLNKAIHVKQWQRVYGR